MAYSVAVCIKPMLVFSLPLQGKVAAVRLTEARLTDEVNQRKPFVAAFLTPTKGFPFCRTAKDFTIAQTFIPYKADNTCVRGRDVL